MSDSPSTSPALFGTLGQSLNDEAASALLIGNAFEQFLPSLHKNMSDLSFAVEFYDEGLRTQETGLEAQLKSWQAWLAEQQTQAIDPTNPPVDPLTGAQPSVSPNLPKIIPSDPSTGSTKDERTKQTNTEVDVPVVPSVPLPVRIEAESITLSGEYNVQETAYSSGKQRIHLKKGKGGKGKATATFDGVDGTYAVVIGYHDVARGKSKMSLGVGSEQFNWTSDLTEGGKNASKQNYIRRVLSSGMTVRHGDAVTLSARRNKRDQGVVDYIEFIPVDPSIPLPFRVEAEHMILEGYEVINNQAYASNQRVAQIDRLSLKRGLVAFSFPKEGGTYDIVVGYQDLAKRATEFTLSVRGTDYRWQADADTKSAQKLSAGTAIRRTIVRGVSLKKGKFIQLAGIGDRNDRAAIDYIEFIPTDVTTPTPGEGVEIVGGPMTPPPIEPQAPTGITLSNQQVQENSGAGTIVGQLSTQDPDEADRHTYTLLNDAGGRFEIVDNQIRVKADVALDFEAIQQHTIEVQSTDSSKQSITQTFVIEVTNQNEAPRIITTPPEHGSSGDDYSYTIRATDPDRDDRLQFSAEGLPPTLSLSDNGDGSAQLSGVLPEGRFDLEVTVTDQGGLDDTQAFVLQTTPAIHLKEGNDFYRTKRVALTIPNAPSLLSFRLSPAFDTTDPDHINDAVEVALVDRQGRSLVHALSDQHTALFNSTEGESIQLAPGVSYDADSGVVQVNLVGVPAGTEFEAIFSLVNNDLDSSTAVRVDQLSFIEAPAELSAPVSQGMSAPAVNKTAPDFNSLDNVSSSVNVLYRSTSFHRDRHLLSAAVQLENVGSYAMDAPLIVVVDRISDPDVGVHNPDGYTPDGLPYFDLSHLAANGKLNPSQQTDLYNLVFHNPNQRQFTYELTLLSVVNQGPYITSQANLEVIEGRPYSYDVQAIDPDEDALQYGLVAAPDGMSIDPSTGSISWETTDVGVGNYWVRVKVNDGRGETAEQSFTLSVIDASSNRPPIFTSTPEVDAFINQLYSYDSDAIDADQDDLLYGLIVGPEGMTVNSLTGNVEWPPPACLDPGGYRIRQDPSARGAA